MYIESESLSVVSVVGGLTTCHNCVPQGNSHQWRFSPHPSTCEFAHQTDSTGETWGSPTCAGVEPIRRAPIRSNRVARKIVDEKHQHAAGGFSGVFQSGDQTCANRWGIFFGQGVLSSVGAFVLQGPWSTHSKLYNVEPMTHCLCRLTRGTSPKTNAILQKKKKEVS